MAVGRGVGMACSCWQPDGNILLLYNFSITRVSRLRRRCQLRDRRRSRDVRWYDKWRFFFLFLSFSFFFVFFYWCHTTSGPSSFKLGSDGGNGTWKKKKKKGEKRCVELAECERGKGKYILGRMHTNKGRRFRGNR